jgi:hypothetical protein
MQSPLLCRRGSHHTGGSRVGDQDTLGSDRHCPADRTRRLLANSDRPAPVLAAEVASFVTTRRPDAEALALWLADAVLAARLAWPMPLPLLAAALMHPSLWSIILPPQICGGSVEALSPDGNPEFATVAGVLKALGLRLSVAA